MRLATVRAAGGDGGEVAVVVGDDGALTPVRDLEPGFDGDVLAVLAGGSPQRYAGLVRDAAPGTPPDPVTARFGPPYRHPRKIWGIGLNYRAHAADLGAPLPDEPASFMKGDHTIIGPGDPIPVPPQSARTTAEAELGLVIGRTCRDVDPAAALDYVAGVVPVLDQTAEDILQRNPRFLTRAKNFPGFFSFGPIIVPLAEVGPLGDLTVATVHNGRVHRALPVSDMTFDPAYLVSFHSQVMPLFAGDIIATGTPGAVPIRPGDVVECRIDGVGTLANPVTAG